MGEIHHNNSFPHFTVSDKLNGLSEESNSENMESLTLSAVIFFSFSVWKINVLIVRINIYLPQPICEKSHLVVWDLREHTLGENSEIRGIYILINNWMMILRSCFFLELQYVYVYKIIVEVLFSSDSEVHLLHVPRLDLS